MSTVIEVTNPGDPADIVGSVPETPLADIPEIVERAAFAQKAWSAMSIDERCAVLSRIADAIEPEAGEIGRMISREQGCVIRTTTDEVRRAGQAFRSVVDLAPGVLAPQLVAHDAGEVRMTKRPLGVVACIVPWNAPVGLAVTKIAPALVAGNAVVLKPSPLAPLAVSRVANIIAGFLPDGLLQVVHGGADVGEALIDAEAVRKVSFTGGTETARSIMRQAAKTITGIHLELGGNDPAIVLDDADFDEAVPALAAAAFRRSGQVCYAIKRVYVPRSRHAEFVEKLMEYVAALRVGNALDPETDMGPVVSTQSADRLRALAERTRKVGRDVRWAGHADDASFVTSDAFLRPSVVTDAQAGDEIVVTEQFGPILPVVAYEGEDEAIGWANGTEYGLCASVWSASRERAMDVASRVEAGVTFVNRHGFSPRGAKVMPFGGIKQSGIGWEHGTAGISEYVEFDSYDIAA